MESDIWPSRRLQYVRFLATSAGCYEDEGSLKNGGQFERLNPQLKAAIRGITADRIHTIRMSVISTTIGRLSKNGS
ncbi:hypothetical protein ACN1C3_14300 [Pseudomonas sp. H11T01]|uniref:hypothetical protein n=1 Tax=Pseudomonas sp. H11T01 TaxID=3402749 RepID=UPI003AC0E331